jgi:hypothetical protein
MVVKFFSNKKGGSSKAIDYLLNEREQLGTARVLQGDKDITRKIINSISFKQKVTVGCLNFEEQNLSDEKKRAIMQDFEETLLPGLDKNEYNILWVEHTDKQHTELNFVIPKIHLESKKSLNPYYHKADLKRVDLWQSKTNLEHNLSNPKDPSKKRTHEVHQIRHINKDYEQLDKLLHNLVEDGTIKNRDHLKELLTDNGYTITRSGKDYISLKTPESKRATKMKGAIYNERFTSLEELRTISKETSRDTRKYNNRDTQRELRDIREQLNKHIQDKSEKLTRQYHRELHQEQSKDRELPQEEVKRDRGHTNEPSQQQNISNDNINHSRNSNTISTNHIPDDNIRHTNTQISTKQRNGVLLPDNERGAVNDSTRTTADGRKSRTYQDIGRKVRSVHKQLEESDKEVRKSSSRDTEYLRERTQQFSSNISERVRDLTRSKQDNNEQSESHIRQIDRIREYRQQQRYDRTNSTYLTSRKLDRAVKRTESIVQEKQAERKARYEKYKDLVRPRRRSQGMSMSR